MIFLASNSTRFTGDVRVRVRVRVRVHVSTLAPNCTCTFELGWGDYRDMCCMFVLVQMHAYARAHAHARTHAHNSPELQKMTDWLISSFENSVFRQCT